MLAHLQGQLFNAASLASSLGISAASSGKYLDNLCKLLLVRKIEPHFVNLGQRSSRAPGYRCFMGRLCYRTAAGSEMDVGVEIGQRKIGFEVKFSSAPSVTKGFWHACDDLQLDAAYVVAPVTEGWVMKPAARVISVMDIPRALRNQV
jgi:uncharacterized protein